MNRSDGPSNEFEAGKARTAARDVAQASIEELRQRGGPFVAAVRATRMPMVLTDPNLPGNPIVFANQAFLNISGYRMDEVLGQQPHFMNGRQTDPQDAARFAESLRSDLDDLVETIQYRKDGSRFVATVLLSAFKDEEGKTLNHFMSFLDVTRRSEAESEVTELKLMQAAMSDRERQSQMLLAELQHRVRNTLAMIRSIVRRTASTSKTVEEFEQHLDGRLGSFARTQAYVTRDPMGSIDLELIVHDELLAHAQTGNPEIVIEGPEVRLPAKLAETLGLAVHELTTNAVKHGALADEGNSIEVRWSLDGIDDGRRLNFRWREKLARRKLSKPNRAGFGTELLDRVMSYELDADPRIEFKPDGFSYEVIIPLPNTPATH